MAEKTWRNLSKRAATTRPARPSPQLTIDDALDKETSQWP